MTSINGIAIVGMAGRFPGAAGLDRFWANLRDGVESITFFTDEELAAAGVSEATLARPDYVKARPLVEGVEMFDARFFGLAPREAAAMDPQHRLFLECAWEALENAGHDAERFPGRIGVYGGCNLTSYLLFNLLANPEVLAALGGVQGRIGVDKDFLTTQVSYRLNLRGPSFAVQTACSTSLVAIHVACQSLLDGECDMALAGGVGVNLPQKSGYLYEEGGVHSSDGHCRAFDAAGQGTLLGDGAGIVALRRLADALADGDTLHAVIRGSGINNDGSGKVGFTAPSLDSQAAVIAEALAMAGVDPETVAYVEAHGTATKLGDPIEVAALTQAFRARGDRRRNACALGSVKTNFGHLDAAAGVAGLIKTVLALKHRQIPPSLHFERPNPEIDFASSPFFVNAALRDWPAGATPRRAGVSSFGIGGTNAHAVVEEAPEPEPSGPSRPWQLLPISAKTPAALETATRDLSRALDTAPLADIADIAFTLQNGRKAFPHRRVAIVSDAPDAAAVLASLDASRTATATAGAHERTVAFLFPGQGAQHVNMARDLYEGEPAFRQELDRCAELLSPHLGLDLRTVLYPEPGDEDDAARRLEQTELTQPALFAVEYALARLWISWGIRPAAMLGHSVGEYVAACLAGVFSLQDALALIAARGRLIQGTPGGAMLAVPLPEAEVASKLPAGLSIAAVNGPEFCVVAGSEEAVESFRLQLDAERVECTRLHTSHAFHSETMAPILGPFAERVARVGLSAPQIPYLSNVTGTWITAAEATDPSYWARHLRSTVRLGDGLAELLADPDRVLLEVGPGQTLTTLARQIPGCRPADAVASLRRPKDPGPDLPLVLLALGKLWAAGCTVDWKAFTAGERRRRVPLPTYPFERQRYWIDPIRTAVSAEAEPSPSSPVKQRLERWFYVPAWKQEERITPPVSAETDPGSWLIFLDRGGLGRKIAERLRQRGARVRTAEAGEARERKDYGALLHGGLPPRILHLWNADPGGDRDLAFHSLLFLVQAIGEEGPDKPVRIGAVSTGLQSVTGDEPIEPEKALLLGLCRVVPQESAQLSVTSIDIRRPVSGSREEAELADRLISEMETDGGRVVALRGRHRWVLDYEAAPLDERFSHPAALRNGGVYLLTGGLDPTALVFARHLAQQAGARLAVGVPPGFPERERWDDLAGPASGGHDPVRRAVETFRGLEASGTDLLLLPLDLSEASGARQAVESTLERFGALHGVLHVEMMPGAGLIQLKTPEMSAPVLRPRVEGTLALAEALRQTPLDFFALFASNIGVTGGLGQVDFCAANNFLDAFARAERARPDGLPVVSIDWGGFRWEEWQMSLGGGPNAMQSEVQKSLEVFGIDEAESLEAFRRALASGVPQIVVSTGDLSSVIAHHDAMTADLVLQPASGAGGGHARPALSTSYMPPGNEVEEGIAAIWGELLGIDGIGVHDNFFELAGNSLTAIQIITRIRKRFDVDLSMSSIFESPTVAGLAQIVQAGRLGEEALAEVDEILSEIEGLSPEELERLLAEEMELESGGEATHGG